jgi:hypothetical protein
MSKKLDTKQKFALKPDAQAFDEIRIKVKNRFKTSGLSGNEWRISAEAEFYRKGELIDTVDCGPNMETACGLLYHRLCTQIDNGQAFFGADIDHCAQEGCSEKPTYLYRIKEAYNDQGMRTEMYDGYHRAFCDRHHERGDSALGDNDNNYELITVL